jgi:hypothetical protein
MCAVSANNTVAGNLRMTDDANAPPWPAAIRLLPRKKAAVRLPDETTLHESYDRERITRLEERLARLEAHLGLVRQNGATSLPTPPPALAPVFATRESTGEGFEIELGRNWFAVAGIAVLTAGAGFLVCLPHAQLPVAIPAIAGFLFAAVLLIAGRASERSSPVVAGYLRGAAMVLLGIAGLRLFLFGREPAINVTTFGGRGVILVLVALNIATAIRRQSQWLMGLALVIACVLALALGAPTFVMLIVAGVAIVAGLMGRKENWTALVPTASVLVPATYFAWAMGNPFRAGAMHFVHEPGWAPGLLLMLVILLGAAPLLRRERHGDDAFTNVVAVLNCLLGYGAFLVHTAAGFPTTLAVAHGAAAVALIGLAATYFLRERSRVSTFLYAMTGYGALSLAILKVSSTPNVFVWLSLQSVVVVATAIWFRSRFIVVANFFIFAAIIVGYMLLATRESGISVGFGIVALVTARILNWKQHRLELKTELMRNAYLVSAFVVFPYALYHLVTAKYVGLAWIALAAAYYVLNFAVRTQKYRWMGHATLMLATVYIVGLSVSRFEPVYRVLSFFVLGAVLLTVSLSFSRAQRRIAAAERKRNAS